MSELYAAESRIENLKQRIGRCVCKFCGGPLSIKRITFSDFEEARLEIFCEACDRIEFGVEPEIYRSAQNFVDAVEFQYYLDLENNARTRRMNVAKVCEIMAWGYKNVGLLDADGFTVPVKVDDGILDETLVLSEDELAERKVSDERGDH